MLNFLIATAGEVATTTAETTAATGEAAGQPNGLFGNMNFIIMMVVVFAVMMFFTSRSNRRNAKQREMAIAQLVKGSKVILNSGIYGAIAEVKPSSFVVEIAPNVNIEVMKNSVNVVNEPKAVDPAEAAKK